MLQFVPLYGHNARPPFHPPNLRGHLYLALTAVTPVTFWNLDFTVRSLVKDLLGLPDPTRHLVTTRALRSRPTGHAIFYSFKRGAVFLGDLMTRPVFSIPETPPRPLWTTLSFSTQPSRLSAFF